jgi:hypothetical protein
LREAEGQEITGASWGGEDESGRRSEASAIIESPRPGRAATFVTNEKGQYRFPALAPGLYTLTIGISGFDLYEEGSASVGATLESR